VLEHPGRDAAEEASGRERGGSISALLTELAREPEASLGGAWDQWLRPGAVVGRFELVRELGRGGFGVVWEARDRELGRAVAFKAVRAGDQAALREERLLREAEAAARLSHPNIVTLFDVGRSEHGPYLVLELLRGQPLSQRLSQEPLSLREALRIAMEIARGLAHAHAAGVVHRDLKPANVVLCDDGRVKVLDFGLAHAFGRRRASGGTPAYMAPEQWRGAPEDERTDVFALGVTLHRMLSGELPFPGDSGKATVGPDPAPRLEVPDLPELGTLVGRMLAKDPVDRPRDGAEVLAELQRIADSLPRTPAGSATPVRVTRSRPLRGMRLARALFSISVLAAAAGLSWSVLRRHPGRSDRDRSIAAGEVAGPGVPLTAGAPSIAVLPFTDLSAMHDQEYFADGVAEEILGALSQVEGLRVAGRVSSFSFMGKSLTAARIARELNVGHLLEGSVRREGSRVRITAQLINAADGYHVWSQTYDRELSSIFAVQDEIAGGVVAALRVWLVPGRREPSTKEYRTDNPEVYRLYLCGRFWSSRYTREGARRALECLEKAVALEPGYAPAHAALATAYAEASAEATTGAEIAERYRQVTAEGEKAVELAPDLAVARSTRGFCRFQFAHDWSGAQSDLARALELNPTDPESHRRMGMLLAGLGRLPEALAEARKSTELDPLDALNWHRLASYAAAQGNLDAAQDAALRAHAVAPEEELGSFDLAGISLLRGNAALALAQSARLEREEGRLFYEAIAAHDLGREQQSAAALAALTAKYGDVDRYLVASAHAWRGERDEAFRWLEAAVEIHSHPPWLKIDPFLRKLHEDPRWPAFLRKLNLPAG
jgi:serine/threonine protein kinase/tetratricopeptide (TPR) repeat protein